ncbi:MAG: DUF933 domain-containing protein [Synergistetes bacterium]|nr:DUF933 domain-containing protein [Synergistota bacterium]
MSGKTTVFNALTGAGAKVEISGGFKVTANMASIPVPDDRLDYLAGLYKPKSVVPAKVNMVDVAGLVTEGKRELDERYISYLKNTDALAVVLKYFTAGIEDGLHPEEDFRRIVEEFILSDLSVVENRLKKLKKGRDTKETDFLLRCKECLEGEKPLNSISFSLEETNFVRGFAFLSAKPVFVILNIDESSDRDKVEAVLRGFRDAGIEAVSMYGKLEMDIMEVEEKERKEYLEEFGIGELGKDKVLRAAYNTLNLISFFTAGEKEVRAWEVKRGATAVEAAGRIHTDMERGFIKAKVVSFSDLKVCGSMGEAKKRGLVRMEGRDYIVKDGDIVEIFFNV